MKIAHGHSSSTCQRTSLSGAAEPVITLTDRQVDTHTPVHASSTDDSSSAADGGGVWSAASGAVDRPPARGTATHDLPTDPAQTGTTRAWLSACPPDRPPALCRYQLPQPPRAEQHVEGAARTRRGGDGAERISEGCEDESERRERERERERGRDRKTL